MADRGSMPGAPREVKLGYLHVGAVEHGICRYGRLLAAEARRQPNVRVLERSIVLTDRPARNARIVRDAAEALSAADLIHIQISTAGDATWGRDLRAVVNLSLFRRFSGKPLAATLHDATTVAALGIDGVGPLVRRVTVETLKGPMRPMVRLARQVAARRIDLGRLWRPIWDFRHVSPYVVARWAARRAHGLFVLTRKERDALTALRRDGRLVLIPHFVEQAPAPVSPMIRPGRTRTVALAGFIFASKGHHLLIDAMPFMPDVKVVFVGGAGFGRSGPGQYRALLEQAQRRGVRGRLEVTGYLDDAAYGAALRQADLAVCPFEDNKAASGSLSSLIAVDCPILASDTPLIAEYNALSAGAIATFSPFTPRALAARIRELLDTPREQLTRGLGELRERLSIARIAAQHIETYRRLLDDRSDPGASPGVARRMEPA